MHAVRPQLLAQNPSRRLSAGQVEAYLYIWSLDRQAGARRSGARRSDGVRSRAATGQPVLSGVSSLGLGLERSGPYGPALREETEEMHEMIGACGFSASVERAQGKACGVTRVVIRQPEQPVGVDDGRALEARLLVRPSRPARGPAAGEPRRGRIIRRATSPPRRVFARARRPYQFRTRLFRQRRQHHGTSII